MNIIIDDNLIFYGEEEIKAPKKKKETRTEVSGPVKKEALEVCCTPSDKCVAPTAA